MTKKLKVFGRALMMKCRQLIRTEWGWRQKRPVKKPLHNPCRSEQRWGIAGMRGDRFKKWLQAKLNRTWWAIRCKGRGRRNREETWETGWLSDFWPGQSGGWPQCNPVRPDHTTPQYDLCKYRQSYSPRKQVVWKKFPRGKKRCKDKTKFGNILVMSTGNHNCTCINKRPVEVKG